MHGEELLPLRLPHLVREAVQEVVQAWGTAATGPPQLLTLSPDGRLPMSLSPRGPGQDGLGHCAARGPHGTHGLRARDATPSVWQTLRRCMSQAGEGTGPRSSAWPRRLRRHPARPRHRYLCPRAPQARPPRRTRQAWPRRRPAGRTGRPAPSPRPSQRSAAFLPGAGPWGPENWQVKYQCAVTGSAALAVPGAPSADKPALGTRTPGQALALRERPARPASRPHGPRGPCTVAEWRRVEKD